MGAQRVSLLKETKGAGGEKRVWIFRFPLEKYAFLWYPVENGMGDAAMTDAQRRAAAKQFAADWRGRGDEKQETQAFWLALLQIGRAHV